MLPPLLPAFGRAQKCVALFVAEQSNNMKFTSRVWKEKSFSLSHCKRLRLVMSNFVIFTTANSASTTYAQSITPARPSVSVVAQWKVQVGAGTVFIKGKKVSVAPTEPVAVGQPEEITVTAEQYSALPLFDGQSNGWKRGARLKGTITQETSAENVLIPQSVLVTSAQEGGQTYAQDKDYALDSQWGTIGRLPGSAINQKSTVYISYRYSPARLDSITVNESGKIQLRAGVSRVNLPLPPAIENGEVRLANIWIPPLLSRLSDDNIFPISEAAYSEPPAPSPSVAERVLPKTLRKLMTGEPVKILAWGDSVTNGGFLPSSDDRWQNQFLRQLKLRYPKANVELVTESWPSKNSGSYLSEPPSSPHNYQEKVLGAKPDLIISEFVNDSGLTVEQVEERYGALLNDFQRQDTEWIILTPHYVTPNWMKLTRQKDIDEDPRVYVAALRRFAQGHPVALADASLRWGRLWRQGLPYTTLLSNGLNHPDTRGMKLFADSLLRLFNRN